MLRIIANLLHSAKTGTNINDLQASRVFHKIALQLYLYLYSYLNVLCADKHVLSSASAMYCVERSPYCKQICFCVLT